jgi:RHS repeat-associated protein
LLPLLCQGWESTNLNRLVTGTPSSGNYLGSHGCWSYDAFGNRTAESLQNGACPASTQSLTPTANYNGDNQVTFTTVNSASSGLVYDAAGNVLNDNVNQYLYDAEGRVSTPRTKTSPWGPRICAVSYTPIPGITIVTGYFYNADGIRVAKGSLSQFSCNFATNGFTPTTSWVLGPGGQQITELTVSGGTTAWKHTNVFGGQGLMATYADTNTYFALNDWLGTKRAEVGASGCVSAFVSLPFGDGLNTVKLPGYNLCQEDATEHHFTGKERDTESGNDYFGARYYSSAMGRFMSPDWSAKAEPVPYAKMDNPQSLNLYAYVGNNPLSRIDKDGHLEDEFHKTGSEMVVHSLDGQAQRSGDAVTGVARTWQADTGYVLGDDHKTQVSASVATGPIELRPFVQTADSFSGKTTTVFGPALADSAQKLSAEGINPNANGADCHGTTFGGGKVWINNDQVSKIISADGYHQTSSHQPGDVGIYTSNGNLSTTLHSVRQWDSEMVWSKGGITNGTFTVPEAGWSGPAQLDWYTQGAH